MQSYRLYCFGGRGKAGHVEIFKASDDNEAVRLAHAKRLDVSCEVWDGERLVAHIRATEDYSGAAADPEDFLLK